MLYLLYIYMCVCATPPKTYHLGNFTGICNVLVAFHTIFVTSEIGQDDGICTFLWWHVATTFATLTRCIILVMSHDVEWKDDIAMQNVSRRWLSSLVEKTLQKKWRFLGRQRTSMAIFPPVLKQILYLAERTNFSSSHWKSEPVNCQRSWPICQYSYWAGLIWQWRTLSWRTPLTLALYDLAASVCRMTCLPSKCFLGHGVPFDLANSSRPWGSLCQGLGSEARKHEGWRIATLHQPTPLLPFCRT